MSLNRARRTIAIAVLPALFAAAALSRAQPSGGGPPPASVRVDAARLEPVEPLREVQGELRAVQRSLVAAEVSGRVIEIGVEPGDAVEAGRLLTRLDDTFAAIDLKRAEAEVARREGVQRERALQVEKAERDVIRMQALVDRSSGTRTELDDAKTALGEAQARHAQSVAEVDVARLDAERMHEHLEDMSIEAPFAGRVIARRAEVGQWIEEGEAVAELVAMGDVDAWINVPQRFIAGLREPGRRVQVRIDATDEIIEAPVSGVIAAADPLSRTFPVRLRLSDKDGLLRPGMSVMGFVPTGDRAEMLTIHKDAILRDDAGAYVYFDAGGMAMVARVEALFAVGDRIAVRAPQVRPGALLVTEGNERLFPTQPLTILNPPPPPAAGGQGERPAGVGAASTEPAARTAGRGEGR